MRNNDRILDLSEIKELHQCPHVKLKVAKFGDCDLITSSMAQPIQSVDFVAFTIQGTNYLRVVRNILLCGGALGRETDVSPHETPTRITMKQNDRWETLLFMAIQT